MASEKGDMINEDWANLNYYKEENLKLVREGTKENIIFMGILSQKIGDELCLSSFPTNNILIGG